MDIRAEREAISMSQGDLAKAIGMSQTTLSRIESGDRKATQGEEALIRAALGDATWAQSAVDEVEAGGPPIPATTQAASYPAAPTDPKARRAHFAQRNRIFQTQGIKAPVSGTFGKQPKAK